MEMRDLIPIGLIAAVLGGAIFPAGVPAEAAPVVPAWADGGDVFQVVDRLEMRSYQPYQTLQFGFRPTPPVQRGVRSSRPEIVMPRRVTPLVENGPGGPRLSLGYAYCADRPTGTIEMRDGPYGAHPLARATCP